MEEFLGFTRVLSIKVSKGPVSSASDVSPESDESQSETSDHSEPSEEIIDLEGRYVKFCAMERSNCWDNFGELVDKAVEREQESKLSVASTVVVDFGELSFVEQGEQAQKVEDNKENAIRRALGYALDEKIWCMLCLLTISRAILIKSKIFFRYTLVDSAECLFVRLLRRLEYLYWFLVESFLTHR